MYISINNRWFFFVDVCISPDETLIVCGTFTDERKISKYERGKAKDSSSHDNTEAATKSILSFYEINGASTDPVMQIGISKVESVLSHAIFVKWIESTNQILCGYYFFKQFWFDDYPTYEYLI